MAWSGNWLGRWIGRWAGGTATGPSVTSAHLYAVARSSGSFSCTHTTASAAVSSRNPTRCVLVSSKRTAAALRTAAYADGQAVSKKGLAAAIRYGQRGTGRVASIRMAFANLRASGVSRSVVTSIAFIFAAGAALRASGVGRGLFSCLRRVAAAIGFEATSSTKALSRKSTKSAAETSAVLVGEFVSMRQIRAAIRAKATGSAEATSAKNIRAAIESIVETEAHVSTLKHAVSDFMSSCIGVSRFARKREARTTAVGIGAGSFTARRTVSVRATSASNTSSHVAGVHAGFSDFESSICGYGFFEAMKAAESDAQSAATTSAYMLSVFGVLAAPVSSATGTMSLASKRRMTALLVASGESSAVAASAKRATSSLEATGHGTASLHAEARLRRRFPTRTSL